MPTFLLASLATYTEYIYCFSQNILWSQKKYANSGPDLSKCKAHLGVPLSLGSTEISQPWLNCILLPQITSHFSFVVHVSLVSLRLFLRENFLCCFLGGGRWGDIVIGTMFFNCEQILLRVSSGWNISIRIVSEVMLKRMCLEVVRFHNYSQFWIFHINKRDCQDR